MGLQDLEQRQLTRAELLVAKETAEAANRAKSEFLASLSHEIRTPMNGILGLTDVILDSELNADQRECLNLVKASAESLLVIVNDVLDLSKIEAGKLVLQMREFWLRDLLNRVIKRLAVSANEKHLDLICNIPPEIPEVVLGDSARLRQVLVNLVGNAVQFTNAGEVVLSVETSPDRAGTLHFSVRDTGSGIPAEMRGMIFDAFTQGNGSTTRKFRGTGLGLTIASRLVEMMGGRIWVESDGHAGSTFHFTARLETPVSV